MRIMITVSPSQAAVLLNLYPLNIHVGFIQRNPSPSLLDHVCDLQNHVDDEKCSETRDEH